MIAKSERAGEGNLIWLEEPLQMRIKKHSVSILHLVSTEEVGIPRKWEHKCQDLFTQLTALSVSRDYVVVHPSIQAKSVLLLLNTSLQKSLRFSSLLGLFFPYPAN